MLGKVLMMAVDACNEDQSEGEVKLKVQVKVKVKVFNVSVEECISLRYLR